VIENRPADDLMPMFESIKSEFGNLAKTTEELLSCALFPQIAVDYLTSKSKQVVMKKKDVDEVIEINLIAL
jgi:oxaloacetate decarboxylase alpha subunit